MNQEKLIDCHLELFQRERDTRNKKPNESSPRYTVQPRFDSRIQRSVDKLLFFQQVFLSRRNFTREAILVSVVTVTLSLANNDLASIFSKAYYFNGLNPLVQCPDLIFGVVKLARLIFKLTFEPTPERSIDTSTRTKNFIYFERFDSCTKQILAAYGDLLCRLKRQSYASSVSVSFSLDRSAQKNSSSPPKTSKLPWQFLI